MAKNYTRQDYVNMIEGGTGGSVFIGGRLISRVEDIPSDEEILATRAGDPDAMETEAARLDGVATQSTADAERLRKNAAEARKAQAAADKESAAKVKAADDIDGADDGPHRDRARRKS